MSDPLSEAKALLQAGDVDGAERSLATAALLPDGDRDRAARALVALCERRGEVSLRAQQALDAFLSRRSPGADNDDARRRVQGLYRALGIDSVGVTRAPAGLLPDLPSLEGFAPPRSAEAATHRHVRPQSLADVGLADELHDDAPELTVEPALETESDEIDASASSEPADTVRTAGPPEMPAHDAATPGAAHGNSDVQRLFAPGSLVNDRYEVLARVGRGGHATVLRVLDRELDEECALKVFHNTGDGADVARFKREVSISRRIVHENVVKLYDIGQAGGYYYLTMELLDGEDLGGLLRRRAITLREALRWLVDACRGLQAAHDTGVVHRDVKPGNLFVLANDRLKVTDFGIAKPADALSLTSTGMFVGTPQYVSPEQVKGAEITPAADIYSLGVVAYVMLTGSLPFPDKEMMALLMKHATARPDPPRAKNPNLPARLDELLVACLEKEPADRPASCAAVADAIEDILRLGR